MKHILTKFLAQKNLNPTDYNLDNLYQAGMKNIILNIEDYYDKPYSCESVLQELFKRGVIEHINKK